jgi:hypothetical protein
LFKVFSACLSFFVSVFPKDLLGPPTYTPGLFDLPDASVANAYEHEIKEKTLYSNPAQGKSRNF